MINKRKQTHKAQALLEVTILTSLFVFLLGSIVRMGVSSNERQRFMMETFKHAITRASKRDIKENSLVFEGQYNKNYRVPDIASASGVRDLQQLTANWVVQRTDRMNFAKNINFETMRRRHVLVGSDSTLFTDIDQSGDIATGGGPLTSGFTTEGWKEGFSLPPLYSIPDPYEGGASRNMMCFRRKMIDPDDLYPSDGINWSWVAICISGYNLADNEFRFNTGGGANKIPYFRETVNQGYSSYYVSDLTQQDLNNNGNYVVHPSSSGDQLSGARFYGSKVLSSRIFLYFQSAYDPSVPLNKNFMRWQHCNEGSVFEPQMGSCVWTQDDMDGGPWILFAHRNYDEAGFSSYLIDGLKGMPTVARGMSIWLSFDELKRMLPNSSCNSLTFEDKTAALKDYTCLKSQMVDNEKFQAAVADTQRVRYSNCKRGIRDTEATKPWQKEYSCGAEFSILALEASKNESLKTFNSNDIEYKFGTIYGMSLSHPVWGDINPTAAASRMPDQGIREYKIESDIEKIEVITEGTGDTISSTTDVELTDTVTRTLITNPFGRYGNYTAGDYEPGIYEIEQEREVSGQMYEYEVQR